VEVFEPPPSLKLTYVSPLVYLRVGLPSGAHDQIFASVGQLQVS
jgi:hypothetical protein